MFGYLKPDLPYLYLKDDTLYKALYCGVCKSIGRVCGQRARIGLSYDVAFLSAVIHNLSGVDVTIKKERCVAHPVISRSMASRDEITDECAAVNVALAYYKVKDDIIDEGRGKLKLFLFKKGQKRGYKRFNAISDIVEKRYDELRALEKNGENRIDAICDPFSLMLKDLGALLLRENASDDTDDMFYFLGKWIYLIDALDDYDKDLKRGNYNPFYYAYGKQPSAKKLLENCGKDVTFVFADIFSKLHAAVSACKWKFNHDLINNILTRGVQSVTVKVIDKINNTDKKNRGEEK
ncbi:MAG: hypothetical protein J6N93_01640 [Clostridia bacterium]|nr:hypothetical protein [Clostridia bacterium]